MPIKKGIKMETETYVIKFGKSDGLCLSDIVKDVTYAEINAKVRLIESYGFSIESVQPIWL